MKKAVSKCLSEASVCILEGRPNDAIRILEHALSEMGEVFLVRQKLGVLLSTMPGEAERSAEILGELVRVSSKNVSFEALWSLSRLKFESGAYDECENLLRKFLRRRSSPARKWFESDVFARLSMCCAFTGKWTQAARWFRRVPVGTTFFEARGYWPYEDMQKLIAHRGAS